MRHSTRLPIACALLLASCDRGTAPDPLESERIVPGDLASLQRTVAGIQRDLSAMRSVPFDAPVVASWVKRDRLRSLLDSIEASIPLEPDTSSGPHPTSTEILVALDLMDASISAEEEQREFEGDNITGFYIPGTGKFWMVEDPQLTQQEAYTVVAHELAHALQDWNWADTAREGAGSDEYLALNHLIEGEAEYLGDLWSLPGRSPKEFESRYAPITLDFVLDAARSDHPTTPLALVVPIYSQYWVSEWAIHSQRMALGWSPINALHIDPPRATKRMVHPFAGVDSLTFSEWPEEVFQNHAGLVPLGSDRLGEVYLAVMLHWRMPSQKWNSSSWKGDRFWLWRAGDSLHHIAAGKIRFESAPDAQQFLRKWAAGRGIWFPGDQETDSLESLRADTSLLRAVRKGSEVALLYGSHPGRWPAAVADSLWSELVAARPMNVSAARTITAGGGTFSKVDFPRFPGTPVRIRKDYSVRRR